MYFVTMTDKFMSGWGCAEGRISKFVVECETLEQAETIERNARKRDEMRYVNVTTKRPYFNPRKYITTTKKYSNLGSIWKE